MIEMVLWTKKEGLEDIYYMIVPKDIHPIDYISSSNRFVFITQEMILYVNYEEKLFDIEMPNQITYHRTFDYLDNPEDWFITLDFGLVEWIQKALKWNKTKSKPKDQSVPFSFEVETIVYSGEFNPKTSALKLTVPARTIVCQKGNLVTDFPELQFMEFGKLITELTTEVILKMQKSGIEMSGDNQVNLPIVFAPKPIQIDKNTYEFDYIAVLDLALLVIPERELKANLQLIESELPELAELHQGMLYDVIRSVVYDG